MRHVCSVITTVQFPYSLILEKLIHLRLNFFLETRNCYYPFQFGFRLDFSTNNALISIVENTQTQLDDGKYSAGVFVDLKKASDTVDHNILLKKLDYYGVRGLQMNGLHHT